jgi:hypothetical protein
MPEIPYILRKQQHRIGKTGRKSEASLARALGGRARPASGALPGSKGDIDLGAFLLEAKSTTQESMILKMAWLLKIAREAKSEGKTPALSVSFVDQAGQPFFDGEWVLVPIYKFKEMLSWGA